MSRRLDIPPGTVFGRLTVIEEVEAIRADRDRQIKRRFRLRCECGNERTARLHNLSSGVTTSCGCSHTQHGKASTPTYHVWENMVARCRNPNHPSFRDYGARGILVDDGWLAFETFFADMGEQPPGVTLERIDNDGNYSKANCRWASYRDQARNNRRTRLVSLDGRTMCASDAAQLLCLPRGSISCRVRERKITHQQAVDYYAARRGGA